MRALGLDIGDRKIGVAISDETGTIAQSLLTLRRKSLDQDLLILKNLVKEKVVNLLIVGLPLNMNGTLSKKALEILKFIEILKENIEIPIQTYDERLTSKEAESILIEGGVSRKKRKDKIDKIAAQIILQNYLDNKDKVSD